MLTYTKTLTLLLNGNGYSSITIRLLSTLNQIQLHIIHIHGARGSTEWTSWPYLWVAFISSLENMYLILVTAAVFQDEMSPLKDDALQNMSLIEVNTDMSQDEMSP